MQGGFFSELSPGAYATTGDVGSLYYHWDDTTGTYQYGILGGGTTRRYDGTGGTRVTSANHCGIMHLSSVRYYYASYNDGQNYHVYADDYMDRWTSYSAAESGLHLSSLN